MRYIDAFNHFFPKRYYDALLETPAGAKDLGKRVRGIPALSDIDLRRSIVESFDNYTQLLSHGLPPMERLWGPDKSPDMAKLANDGLAEVVAKYPKHFVGWSALLPMNAPEAAAKEAESALANGANAVQLGTNANGVPLDAPQFLRSSKSSHGPASRSCCTRRAPATCRIIRRKNIQNTKFAACLAGPTKQA
jgi:uncharacterized protein